MTPVPVVAEKNIKNVAYTELSILQLRKMSLSPDQHLPHSQIYCRITSIQGRLHSIGDALHGIVVIIVAIR